MRWATFKFRGENYINAQMHIEGLTGKPAHESPGYGFCNMIS